MAMYLSGRERGMRVLGSELEYLGKALRLSATNRAAMGWYRCLKCVEIKTIRCQNVK